jgi:ribonuclease P protein component
LGLICIFTKILRLNNTFHKNERLCSKKHIDTLFEKGQTLSAYPIKLIWLGSKNENRQVQAMFVVPKKKFKHANDRNTLKRRMREAYRLQKGEFYLSIGSCQLDLAILYYANKSEEYDTISKAMAKLLNNLTKQISGNGN